jgi:hypothetical protein
VEEGAPKTTSGSQTARKRTHALLLRASGRRDRQTSAIVCNKPRMS